MCQYVKISEANYCIDELKCICDECKRDFTDYVPCNYELVCFYNNNKEKIFLPTYGEYGYLDLMERLLNNWKQGDTITRKVSARFEQEIQNIVPYKVSLFDKTCCPFCNNDKIKILKRIQHSNFPVKWLEINVKYLQ